MRKKILSIILIGALCMLAFTGCVTLTFEEAGLAGGGGGDYQGDASFDPEQYATDNWETLVSEVTGNAKPYSEIIAAYTSDKEAAGEQYGQKAEVDAALWNFAIVDEAQVLEVDRESKKGMMYMDSAPFDGVADYAVQIGSVYSGTALRDYASFIEFGDFKNQITYSDLAKAINKHCGAVVIDPANVDELVGSTITITGVFPDEDEIVVMPVSIEVEG